MRLIQFLDTQHNLSLPALTEYWLFFDMQKKKKNNQKNKQNKKEKFGIFIQFIELIFSFCLTIS